MKKFNTCVRLIILPLAFFVSSCSEDEPEPEVNCSESTLAITTESPEMAGCLSTNGKIVALGSGGEGVLMYNLNGGPAQASPEFENLGPGDYKVFVTDDTECSVITNVRVLSGISFEAEIMPIIENSCALPDCHDGSSELPNFLVFSNFQVRADQAKTRTQTGDMPRTGSLTADEIAKIACWADDGALAN